MIKSIDGYDDILHEYLLGVIVVKKKENKNTDIHCFVHFLIINTIKNVIMVKILNELPPCPL